MPRELAIVLASMLFGIGTAAACVALSLDRYATVVVIVASMLATFSAGMFLFGRQEH